LDTRTDIQSKISAVTVLRDLAEDIGVSERTLRRAVNARTIHAERPSARRLRLSDDERDWVRAHWPTVGCLREALRTEPAVRLAVLFGSAARGRSHRRSDLDLLVALDSPAPAALAALQERLTDTAGREVQLVTMDSAQSSPGLYADALRDGRVIVDRDRRWPRLKRGEQAARRAAERREREQLERALEPLKPAQ
jgi:predicted nucleotidyltransferase